jgi:hypothetical protein
VWCENMLGIFRQPQYPAQGLIRCHVAVFAQVRYRPDLPSSVTVNRELVNLLLPVWHDARPSTTTPNGALTVLPVNAPRGLSVRVGYS